MHKREMVLLKFDDIRSVYNLDVISIDIANLGSVSRT